MRRLLLLGLALAGGVSAQGYLPGTFGATSPDCVLSPLPAMAAAGRSLAYDNRKSGCIEWTLFWSNTSAVSGFSVELDGAADVNGTFGSWSASTASVGSSNPSTSGSSGVIVIYGYSPWVSVNLNSITGGGSMTVLVIGYRPAAGSNAANVTNASNVQGTGAAGAVVSGNPVLVAGTDGSKTRTVPTASALNLTTLPSIGAILTEKGPRWPVVSAPAAGTQATASKTAGGAGVRHVADCVSFSGASVVAPALTALVVNLRDGATGAGTVLWSQTLAVSAVTGQNVAPFTVCGLGLVGTANTAMTLEFSAGLASLAEAVSLSGFDVQ